MKIRIRGTGGGRIQPAGALKPDAPLVLRPGKRDGPHLVRGDAKKAIENSKYVVTKEYRTPFTKRPGAQCAVAIVNREKRRGSESILQTRARYARRCTGMLGWELSGSMSSTNW